MTDLLSLEHNLTIYDASYVELAIRLGASLGTHDKKIIDSCSHQKITLL